MTNVMLYALASLVFAVLVAVIIRLRANNAKVADTIVRIELELLRLKRELSGAWNSHYKGRNR